MKPRFPAINFLQIAAAALASLCAIPALAEQPGTLPAAKENFHIYLLMGQSNMAGRDTSALAAQTDNPRVLALDANGQWVVARDPIHSKNGRTEPGAGPGIPFALAMIETDPHVTIGLVPCAVGGTPLKRWVKGGDLYAAALDKAKLAAQSGTVKGVLWHQGESDSDKQPWADSYGARLAKMIEDLRADLGQPNLPVVVGQLGGFLKPEKQPFAETVRGALREIPAKVPQTGYADSDGLTDKGDKLHFNAASVAELGRRFAAAMKNLQAKTKP